MLLYVPLLIREQTKVTELIDFNARLWEAVEMSRIMPVSCCCMPEMVEANALKLISGKENLKW